MLFYFQSGAPVLPVEKVSLESCTYTSRQTFAFSALGPRHRQTHRQRGTDRQGGRQTDTERNAVRSDKTGKGSLSGVAMTTAPFTPCPLSTCTHMFTHTNTFTSPKRRNGTCLCVIIVECVQIRNCFVQIDNEEVCVLVFVSFVGLISSCYCQMWQVCGLIPVCFCVHVCGVGGQTEAEPKATQCCMTQLQDNV